MTPGSRAVLTNVIRPGLLPFDLQRSRSPVRYGRRMQLYAIIRRDGWRDGPDLEAAAARSTEVGDKDGSGVRWIRSYVLAEDAGGLGTVCIYEADSPEAIQKHAQGADLPVTEIIPVADTVVVRPDPAAA